MPDPEGVTPLLTALWNAHFDTASYLIKAGAMVNKWDWWGRSPLWLAVDYNTIPHGGRADGPSLDETTALQVIEQLLNAGANPNLQLKLLPPYRTVGADRGVDEHALHRRDAAAARRQGAGRSGHRSAARTWRAAQSSQQPGHHADHGGGGPGIGGRRYSRPVHDVPIFSRDRSLLSIFFSRPAARSTGRADARNRPRSTARRSGDGTTSSNSWWLTARISTPRTPKG